MQFWWKGGQNLILKQRMFYLLFLLKSSELAEEKTCKDCRVFLMIQRKLPTCQHRLLSMCIRDQEKLNHSTTSNIHIGLQWTLSPGKLTAPDCVCFLIKTKVMKMSLTDPLDNKHARWSDFFFFLAEIDETSKLRLLEPNIPDKIDFAVFGPCQYLSGWYVQTFCDPSSIKTNCLDS